MADLEKIPSEEEIIEALRPFDLLLQAIAKVRVVMDGYRGARRFLLEAEAKKKAVEGEIAARRKDLEQVNAAVSLGNGRIASIDAAHQKREKELADLLIPLGDEKAKLEGELKALAAAKQKVVDDKNAEAQQAQVRLDKLKAEIDRLKKQFAA